MSQPDAARDAPTGGGAIAAPVRISGAKRLIFFLLGALFCGVGVPLGVLVGGALLNAMAPGSAHRSDAPGAACGLALFLGIVLVGLDLLTRAATGRRWSQAFWRRLDIPLQALMRAADRRPWLLPAIWLTTGPVCFAIGYARRHDPTAWTPAFFWLGGFLQVLVHELGHLAAVAAVGYVPRDLAAGPLALHFDSGRPRLGLNTSGFLLGRVSYLRPHPTRAKEAAIALCGPLANVISLAAILALPPIGPFCDLFVHDTAVFTTLTVVANLLPLPRIPGYLANDGRTLLDLWRSRRAPHRG